jgi:hypothetical protein
MDLLFLNLAQSSTGIPGNLWALLVPLIILELLLVVFALVDVIRRDPRLVRGNKAVWILVILLIGTLGPICYLIAGRKEA